MGLAGIFVPQSMLAREKIVLGGLQQWGEMQSLQAAQVYMRHGQQVIGLAPMQPDAGPDTQLLLHFDALPSYDEAGKFLIEQDISRLVADDTARGDGAGIFSRRPMRLLNQYADFFRPDTLQHGFTLSFFLYSPALRDGEEIISWRGMAETPQGLQVQQFKAIILNRRVVLSLESMLKADGDTLKSIEIAGDRDLLPRRWTHHFFRYSAETGLLEYYVNGVIRAVKYATSTGREGGSGWPLHIGGLSGTEMIIGEGLSGMLDELLISSAPEALPEDRIVRAEPGRAVSVPLELRDVRNRITEINVQVNEPGSTRVSPYFKIGSWLEPNGDVQGEWRPLEEMAFRNDQMENDDDSFRGRFVQLRFDLQADGDGSNSPEVVEAAVVYEELPPLIVPAGVSVAVEGNGLRVSWNKVHDRTIGGYKVFFGTAPGEYFGEDAVAGISPLDVGLQTSVLLTGLRQDKVYYFSVVSY
ncbi:MAG: hypothetical protein D6B26_06875, partial [Spirochaetaceae bacterium]